MRHRDLKVDAGLILKIARTVAGMMTTLMSQSTGRLRIILLVAELRTIAEISATNPGMITGSDQENNNNNSTLCTHCGKLERIQCAGRDFPAGDTCACAPGISAMRDHRPESGCTSLPDHETGHDGCCPDFRNVSATTSGVQIRSYKVRSTEFCEIDQGFGTGPCDCCGTQWVHYQERMTEQRFNAPPRVNRKICRTCYEVAREAEGASVRPLPGVIDTGSMTRLQTDLGRCQVCDRQKAVWYDTETRTAICDSCHTRISRVDAI